MSDLTDVAPRVFEDFIEEDMLPSPEEPSPEEPTRSTESWPTLGDAALVGLAGDLLRVVEPHAEADPVAVLVHFIVMFGNAVGPGPHVRVSADIHRANLFATFVGDTASGRKGSSEGQARRPLASADPAWARDRITRGLSSGEGLISAVRDAPPPGEAKGEDARPVSPHVWDRRLLVLETEFSATLRTMARDGNILSGVLRQAWDSGDLSVLTRKDPLRATGAHISVIGHVTAPELLRRLEDTETSNGFANRFLWICVRRSKELPDGGNPPESELRPLFDEVRKALDAAKRIGEVNRDARASELWRAVYSELSRERPGLFGAVTSRAEAQVLRLSLLYALMDGSAEIREEHLRAALAVWDCAAASARHVFGDRTGNPLADRILDGLRDSGGGLGRSDISEFLGRNAKAQEIDRALDLLRRFRLAAAEKRQAGQGRPTEWWTAR